MNKRTSSALAGAAVTMAVGTAAYMLSAKTTTAQRRKMRSAANKAVKTAGAVMENINYMMK